MVGSTPYGALASTSVTPLTSYGGPSVQAKTGDIRGPHHGFNGCWVSTFLPVEGHKPPHAAVCAASDPQVPVEGGSDRGVARRLVERAGKAGDGAVVLVTARQGGDDTMLPLRVVEGRVHLGVTGWRGRRVT